MKRFIVSFSIFISFLLLQHSFSNAFTIDVDNPGTGNGTVNWRGAAGGVILESCRPSVIPFPCKLGVTQAPIAGNVLEAVPDTGSFFAGWSNAVIVGCAGTGICTLPAMAAPGSVRATFTACTFVINPQNASYPYSGGAGNISVTAVDASCNWAATESLSWVTITSGSSGQDSGMTEYTVARNNTAAARNGIINIANNIFNISQEASPVKIVVEPDSIDFGTQEKGKMAELRIKISNIGSTVLNISSVEITGIDKSAFLVSSVCAAIPGGSFCNSVVGFAPTISGVMSATLLINSDDPVLPAYSVALSGVASDIASASISVSPDEINIPFVDIEMGDTKTISISNSGTGSLIIDSINVKGLDGSEFSVNSNCIVIAPNSNCNFSLLGRYTSQKAKQISVVIASNAISSPRLEIPVTVSSKQCTGGDITLSGTSRTVSNGAANGTVNITWTGSGICVWTAMSRSSWITASANNGSANYSVTPNISGLLRRGNISIAGQPFTIIQNSGASNTIFSDTPDNVFKDYINAIYADGITRGCGQQGSIIFYCPSDNVTMGQMAVFVIRAIYGEAFHYTQTPYFTDVPDTHTFFKYVQKMKDAGITAVSGIYYVDDYVTRGQMAVFIIRAIYGEAFSYTQTPYFIDVPDTHTFFEYVQKMKDTGITAVSGIYRVDDYVTREEMAACVSRAFLDMR
jgi:hypothetical protein